MSINIIMPEMGEGVIEGTVSRWLKQVGDFVDQDEPLLEIETDKVTTEAAAEEAGVLSKILIPEGETVAVGTVLGILGDSSDDSQPSPKVNQTPAITKSAVQEPILESVQLDLNARDTNGQIGQYSRKRDVGWVSPVVARMAEEHNLDLTQINGTGKKGRITKRDVVAYLETVKNDQIAVAKEPPPPVTQHPSPTTQPPPPITHHPTPIPASSDFLPHTNLRRQIADHMVMSKRTSPHVTTVFEADFSAVWAHRAANKAEFAAKGVKLTFTPYLILAITHALQRHPRVNSSWQDDGLALHRSINIGMATAIKEGLIVPVIKGADGYNLLGMSRAVNDLADRARENKLKPAEVVGGTFTLTNHGVSGSLFATPIINQPQCGILGVGTIQKRVVVVTDEFDNDAMVIRPMAYLSFTFDHRILDGASADHFVADIKREIETWT